MKYKLKKGSILLASIFLPLSTEVYANTNEPEDQTKENQEFDLAQHPIVKQNDLIGTTTVDMEELQKVSYSLGVLDNLDAFVAGWDGNKLWGYEDVLILVDGVPREAHTIMASEVASVTFMKSAAATILYGSEGNNGAILITSKKGKIGDVSVDVMANTGMNFMKEIPEYLNSAEYMTYYNQAAINDGKSPLYTDEQIYNYGSGLDPYRYPDLNMYSDDFMNSYFNRTDVSVAVQGGNDRTQFYTNTSYTRNGDYLNFGEAKNNRNERLSARGNVDFKISDIVTSYAKANVVMNTTKSANADFWKEARQLRPNRFSPLVPISAISPDALDALKAIGATDNIIDGKYFLSGTQLEQTNAISKIYAGGSGKSISRFFQFDIGLKIDLDALTKGLSFSGRIAIDYSAGYRTEYNNNYAIFVPTWSNVNGQSSIISLTKYGDDERSGDQNVKDSWMNRQTHSSVQFDYVRSFGKHHVSAMAMARANQKVLVANYHKPSSAHLGFMATYDYDHRYFVDLAGAYVHSAKLPKDKRQAFSPAITLGWNVAKESFMPKGLFDDLMISASLAEQNTDAFIDGYYLYESVYKNNGSGIWYGWGDALGGGEAAVAVIGENPDLTFVKRKEINASINAVMFDRSLHINANYFHSKIDGGITQATTMYPNYFTSYWPQSTFIPYINYNEDLRQGVDISINYANSYRDFKYNVGVTGSYLKTEAVLRDEIYEDKYQNRQGRDLNTIWGLECVGFFDSQDDIKNSTSQDFGPVKPGDLKYVDQNGDNIIDSKDEVALGSWASPYELGLNFELGYKGFTLAAIATARLGGQGVKNTEYDWIYGERKYSAVVRDAWTPETAETATYPRLTTESSSNNFRTSDFWLYNTDRFDLSKVQLTYDFPERLFDQKKVSALSVYVGGYNLLTLAPEAKRMNTNFWGAPYSRFVNLGVKASF